LHNLFADIPDQAPEELVNVLAESCGARIERIVSTGQASPDGFWYDQVEDEWVVVLRGAARLRFEQPQRLVSLAAGDHVWIPAHTRHRVDWTSHREPTVWLAVFFVTPQK
jgi:cupin 2 domain-containing protein